MPGKKSTEELKSKFIKTIDYPAENTLRLFTIGLIGLTGVGKSTVAELLSKKLNLYVASNDKIRRFLNDQGFKGESPEQELLQQIAEESSRYLYKNSISHIIDADLIKFHSVAKKNARSFGARFFLIHLVCPEQVIMQRLDKRSKRRKDKTGKSLSRVGKEEYYKRKTLHKDSQLPEDIYFTVDTSKELTPQIILLEAQLKREGAV